MRWQDEKQTGISRNAPSHIDDDDDDDDNDDDDDDDGGGSDHVI